MSRNINIPYLPNPPEAYDRRYMAQLTQAFALFAQQSQAAGPVAASELILSSTGARPDAATLRFDASTGLLTLTLPDGTAFEITMTPV